MRMLASVIDSLLSIVILLPVFNIFRNIYGPDEIQLLLATGELKPENLSNAQFLELLTKQITSFTLQNAIIAIAVILFWIYCSATPGKMLLKMKIVDAKTGARPSRKQCIIRYFGYIISILPLGLGFIWIYYDRKKQGWHDKIAGTVVLIAPYPDLKKYLPFRRKTTS